MNQLIWTIIGIGLMAAIFAAGQNYLSFDSQPQREARDKVIYAFHSMIAGYNDYKAANATPPSLANWQAELIPNYLTLPIPINSLSWSYANDTTYGDYFCLSGNISQAQNNGINSITAASSNANFPANLLVIAYNACGKRSIDALGSTPASWPGAIYITYWLAGS